MGEDMTYTDAEPTRAQLAARVAEANQYALAMEQDAEALRQRVAELERENAELRARLDAVPVDDITTLLKIAAKPGRAPFVRRRVGEWLATLSKAAHAPDDDTDAPLKLAAVEDGDE